MTKPKTFLYKEQLDLFEDELASYELQEPEQIFEQLWDGSRGRNYIKAQGKNGENLTLVFDHLDQQYHLLDE